MRKKNSVSGTSILLSAIAMAAVFFITREVYKPEPILEDYFHSYSLENKLDIRIDEAEAIKLFKEGKAVLVDVRFPKEQAEMNAGFGYMIPLNELPDRIDELPKDKLIVTGCFMNERGNMARLYLMTKGYKAKHLFSGIPGLTEKLTDEDRAILVE